MFDKTSDLIRFFVRRVPGSGRTQIVKFLYLTDLESRRHLGRPITDLSYIWYTHGPFDKMIFRKIDELQSVGLIEDEQTAFPNGYVGHRYLPVGDEPVDLGDENETALAEYVADAYGAVAFSTLLDEVVYQTAPMLDAQERQAHDQPLRMDLVDGQAREKGVDIASLAQARRQIAENKVRRFEEAAAELGI